jgi:hypothetical protein
MQNLHIICKHIVIKASSTLSKQMQQFSIYLFLILSIVYSKYYSDILYVSLKLLSYLFYINFFIDFSISPNYVFYSSKILLSHIILNLVIFENTCIKLIVFLLSSY